MIVTTKRAILSAFSGGPARTETGGLIGVRSICNQGHTGSRSGQSAANRVPDILWRIVPCVAWTAKNPILFAGTSPLSEEKEGILALLQKDFKLIASHDRIAVEVLTHTSQAGLVRQGRDPARDEMRQHQIICPSANFAKGEK